ncbi:hypothetical protein BUALT_Bualt18G0126100 [Buddleja alternifolia]|uniref:Protein TIFY n=1 Tax=Buddleja alternifolia TaxID=168488 RepID=A0AAV6WA95_9LAMI|nr:hypothetical protein BUALT_Bualt18G0126100 [Buddleja alternifolia]
MRRNCNLELRLETPSVFSRSSDHYNSQLDMVEESGKEKKQLIIFYNGRIAVCDATELQARAIILLASREMEEKSNSPAGSVLYSPSPLYSPTSVLSMQRSLKRFLQKRKSRVQATYPYPPIVPTHSDED